MKLVCRYCQYRYETKRTSIPKLCPYCGQQGTLEKEKDADSLLHEVEEDDI